MIAANLLAGVPVGMMCTVALLSPALQKPFIAFVATSLVVILCFIIAIICGCKAAATETTEANWGLRLVLSFAGFSLGAIVTAMEIMLLPGVNFPAHSSM